MTSNGCYKHNPVLAVPSLDLYGQVAALEVTDANYQDPNSNTDPVCDETLENNDRGEPIQNNSSHRYRHGEGAEETYGYNRNGDGSVHNSENQSTESSDSNICTGYGTCQDMVNCVQTELSELTLKRPDRPTPESMGIIMGRPRYSQFAIMSKRLDSFSSWPEIEGITIKSMAEAGFAYIGTGDSVRCYFCGGGLKCWKPYDDPWVEHALYYKACGHVRQGKGDGFIRQVQKEILGHCDEPEVEYASPSDEQPDVETIFIQESKTSLAVLTASEFGFSDASVKRALKHMFRLGKTAFSATELVEVIIDIDEGRVDSKLLEDIEENQSATRAASESLPSASHSKASLVTVEEAFPESEKDLEEENERLKQQLTCKICLDEQACIIFLPCGHMVCCAQCGPALRKCAICRKSIKGSVRAFRA